MYPPTQQFADLYEAPSPPAVHDAPQAITRRPPLLVRIFDALRVRHVEPEVAHHRVGVGGDCVTGRS